VLLVLVVLPPLLTETPELVGLVDKMELIRRVELGSALGVIMVVAGVALTLVQITENLAPHPLV
jgi:hypothetical protein